MASVAWVALHFWRLWDDPTPFSPCYVSHAMMSPPSEFHGVLVEAELNFGERRLTVSNLQGKADHPWC